MELSEIKLTEMTKRKRTIFIRFLKELGIYNPWVVARKHYMRKFYEKGDYLFKPIDDSDYMEEVLESSFNWDKTGESEMWHNLYYWLMNEDLPIICYFDKCNEEVVEEIERKFYNYMVSRETKGLAIEGEMPI